MSRWIVSTHGQEFVKTFLDLTEVMETGAHRVLCSVDHPYQDIGEATDWFDHAPIAERRPRQDHSAIETIPNSVERRWEQRRGKVRKDRAGAGPGPMEQPFRVYERARGGSSNLPVPTILFLASFVLAACRHGR